MGMSRISLAQSVNVLLLLSGLMMLAACGGTKPSLSGLPPALSCPDSALVQVTAEPGAPADAELNASADRWVFGQLLPWARANAQGRETVKNDCLAQGQIVGEGA